MATTGDVLKIIADDKTNTIFQATKAKQKNDTTNTDSLIESFQDIFKEKINEVDKLIKHEEEMEIKLQAGEVQNLHDVMIAEQKAKIALDLAIAIRSFLLSAYDKLIQLR
ncbi:MAG: flagellar hook-basal body complex protein FliE [Candidatus Hydrogenedentota bacterium]